MDKNAILMKQYQMDDFGRVCSIRDLYTTFSPKIDLEALKNSDFFPALYDMMEVVLDLPDEHSTEVAAYWAKRGMVKEYHGQYTPMSWTEYAERTGYLWEAEKYHIKQNATKLWTSFVPVSAFREENKDKKYPVVFALHGATNNIFLVEGWGFVQEAAKREWIVIIPSIELDDILEEILEEAKKLYPIDETRVYAAGFSYGGWAANRLGNQRPDLFAAVAPCGAAMDDAFLEAVSDDREPLPAFDGKNRAEALGVHMPIINIYGDNDGYRFPIYNFKSRRFGLSRMEEPKDIIEGINHWARVNQADEIDIEDVLALKDREDATPAQKAMGLPLPESCMKTLIADGVTYHIADIKSRDGVTRVRLIDEVNIPHWPTPEMIRQIFAFFSHFSRNKETLESVYEE